MLEFEDKTSIPDEIKRYIHRFVQLSLTSVTVSVYNVESTRRFGLG